MTKAARRQPTLREIEKQMAAEISRIVEQAGDGEARQIARLSEYVSRLYQRHPDWQSVMEAAHQKFLDRPRRRLDPTRAVSRHASQASPKTSANRNRKSGRRQSR